MNWQVKRLKNKRTFAVFSVIDWREPGKYGYFNQ